jgi:WD40 repeat protein
VKPLKKTLQAVLLFFFWLGMPSCSQAVTRTPAIQTALPSATLEQELAATATLPAHPLETPIATVSSQAFRRISPENAADVTALARLGKGTVIAAPTYSPDGALLAVPTTFGVDLYKPGDEKPIRSLSFTPWTPVERAPLAFSPDGRFLATGGRQSSFAPDGQILDPGYESLLVWSIADGKLAWQSAGHPDDTIAGLDFSPDGKFLAAGLQSGEARLMRADDGQVVYSLEGAGLEFSPDSRYILTLPGSNASEPAVRLYELEKDALLRQWAGERAFFTPQGEVVIEDRGSLRIVDPSDNRARQAFSGKNAAVSPDGKLLALYNLGEVKLYNLQSAELIRTLEGKYDDGGSSQFSPDGATIAAQMWKCQTENCVNPQPLVAWWRATDGSLVKILAMESYVPWFSFAPDGNSVLIAQPDQLSFINSADGSPAGGITGYNLRVAGIAFSPDGGTLAAASSGAHLTVQLWDTLQATSVLRLDDPGVISDYNFLPVAFSPDGKMLAVRGDFWDLTSGKRLVELERRLAANSQAGPYWASSVAFAGVGKTLALGYLEGDLALMDPSDGGLIRKLEGFTGEITSLAFSRDAQTLAASIGYPDDVVQVWQLPDGKPLLTLKPPSGMNEFTRVSLSPNGQVLGTVAQNTIEAMGQGVAQLWSIPDGRLVSQPPVNGVLQLAISPDGQVIATGTYDQKIRLWQLSDAKLLQTLDDHTAYITGLAFSPDGTQLASSAGDGAVILWGIQPTGPTDQP